MFVWARAACAAAALILSGQAPGESGTGGPGRYGLGAAPTPAQIEGWDIDIRPDGQGLPPGGATALDGEDIYVERCASCHGEFGEAVGRYPVLMGGQDSLASEEPVKTIGSYWPYASTVFDYVRRAMPFGHAQSLDDNETYAITAYLLYLNEIVDEDFLLSASTLPRVEMPNQAGFITDARPDVPGGEPCMRNCRNMPEIVGKARIIDVTPQDERVSPSSAAPATGSAGASTEMAALSGDPAAGKRVFAQCSACHSLSEGEHRIGPTLHGVVGRAAATASGFDRYSAALRDSGVTWSAESLRRFIAEPQAFISGNSMPFAGVKDNKQLDDLMAYLIQTSAAR